jgi:signal transduction histidine kinase
MHGEQTAADRLVWAGVLHAQTREADAWAALAAAVSACTGRRAFLLRPERHGVASALTGWMGIGGPGATESFAPPSPLSWCAEGTPRPDLERDFAELHSVLRAVRLPLADTGDPLVAALRAARSAEAQVVRVGAPWSDRLEIDALVFSPVLVDGRACAVIAAEIDDAEECAGAAGTAARTAVAWLAVETGRAVGALRLAAVAALRRGQLVRALEVARGFAEMPSLTRGLGRVARVAAQAIGAERTALWGTDDTGRRVRLLAAFGPDTPEENEERMGELEPLAMACLFGRESPLLSDAAAEPRLGPAARGLGAVAGCPVLAHDRVRGALFITRRDGEGAGGFTREDQETLSLFAALAAVLHEQADLSERVAGAERSLAEARGQAQRAQNLAELGEVSVRLAREMTSPLASLVGFAHRVQRSLDDADPNREYLEIVVREAERLDRLVAEHLQFALLQRTYLGLTSLNHLVQESLERSADAVAKKRVRLLKRLSPEVPALLLDAEKVDQAIDNILIHALDGVANGGCLKVETRHDRGRVVLEVAHDGPPLAGEILEHLFIPFTTGGRVGPGLGLAMAQRIVRDHGGEIGVRREGDWGQVLSVVLPVRGNEDRRQSVDRRNVGGDRRNRFALE